MSRRVLVVCDDLFFWASLRDAARAGGGEAVRVGDEEGMRSSFEAGSVDVLVADLGVRGVDLLAWAARWKGQDVPPRLIGYASHVDQEACRGALAAGFDEVLPKSRFSRRIREIVASRP